MFLPETEQLRIQSLIGPKSMYGFTKLAGENFVKDFSKHYFIVRTAWLYGDGKNFLKTMLRLSETHDEITVVDDQIGSPTSAMELARAISWLIPTENYGIYHGTCENYCSWADFTEAIFKKTGKTTKVVHVSTAQYQAAHPESADRPAYSVLWEDIHSQIGRAHLMSTLMRMGLRRG